MVFVDILSIFGLIADILKNAELLEKILYRLKKMESEGYIKGYSAILSPYKLGFDVTAVILMQVEGPHIVEIEQELAKYKEVGCIYDITGEFDVMVITRFRSREDLNRFIKNLLKKPHIKRSVTSIALNIVKEDHRLNI